ncbi:MAG: hypothetical protein PHR16_12455 [Methylovulum sp.]|nr:hypothetical protein [Methylovulum sp.]
MQDVLTYQAAVRAAMQADYAHWRDANWINRTFKPVAELLDGIGKPQFQQREPVPLYHSIPSQEQINSVIKRCMQDILRIWNRDKKAPYFPVAAQVILSGDDHMNGENFLEVLRGAGAFEYQNATLLFALLRCFINSNPAKLKHIRKPYRGIAEKMFQRPFWFVHRTAFYDVNFFEHLLARVTKSKLTPEELQQTVQIMENLLHFCVVTSQEWLVTPNKGIRHPAITCLPLGSDGAQAYRLNKKNSTIKKDLGFGDYVPDTDTTFFALSIAKKWLDLVKAKNLSVDGNLLEECRNFLNYPWIEIITEYQIGSGYTSNPPTIHFTKPLDYQGAVPIWFDKSFPKPDGRVVKNVAGNEICPGHNMDILESILVNRKQWDALQGGNLKTVRRLIAFHYQTFKSGNYKYESAFQYYLPEIYLFYTGRVYDVYLTLSDVEKTLLDPEGCIEAIRQIALDYCKNDLITHTLNAFDAAMAVSALVLLQYEAKDDGVLATGLKVMSDALGEGVRGHPFLPYEWNRMRHPCRIIVGSDVSTSLFVLNAFVNAGFYLYGE